MYKLESIVQISSEPQFKTQVDDVLVGAGDVIDIAFTYIRGYPKCGEWRSASICSDKQQILAPKLDVSSAPK